MCVSICVTHSTVYSQETFGRLLVPKKYNDKENIQKQNKKSKTKQKIGWRIDSVVYYFIRFGFIFIVKFINSKREKKPRKFLTLFVVPFV